MIKALRQVVADSYAVLGQTHICHCLDAEFRTFKNDFADTVEAELNELKQAGTIMTPSTAK